MKFELGMLEFNIDFHFPNSFGIENRLNQVFRSFSLDSRPLIDESICLHIYNSHSFSTTLSEGFLFQNNRYLLSNRIQKELVRTYQRFCYAITENIGSVDRLDLCISEIYPLSLFDTSQLISTSSKSSKIIFIVMNESTIESNVIRIWNLIIKLVSQWLVARDGLLLHSAALMKNNNGYLFLGKSGAGKTTLVELSRLVSCLPLGDDLNVIFQNPSHEILVSPIPCLKKSPVGYVNLSPMVKGIFQIVQDDKIFVNKLNQLEIANLLFDSFINHTPFSRRLTSSEIKKAFSSCCRVSRQIPGYELHFRKSPDFWKVIDAELGLD